jgi:phosphotransferase system HPr (HPr) family protein
MVSATVIVRNSLGIHARAAARFVHAAAQFQSQIRVARGERVIDGKSIMGVLLLAASRGTTLVISADGIDEQAAVESLCALIEKGLGEEPCSV